MKNKHLLILSVFFLNVCFGQEAYKQVVIPISNSSGVPFETEETGNLIQGFGVDNGGYFYFFGGVKSTLGVFHGNKILYRRQYTDLNSGAAQILGDFIYIFDNTYNFSKRTFKNRIIALNKADGTINSTFDLNIHRAITTCRFVDSTLVLNVLSSQRCDSLICFNLSSRIFKKAPNPYNLPSLLYPKEYKENAVIYLGVWGGYYMFYSLENLHSYKFFILNKEGKMLKSKLVNYDRFGKSLVANPDESVKLKDNILYVLGMKGRNAIITIIPVVALFGNP